MKSENNFAKILRVVLKNDVLLTDDWPVVFQSYLNSLKGAEVIPSAERRHAKRQEVGIEAVIRLQKTGNEVVYLPALMKNISASGVMLELQDKGHIMVGSMDDIEQFVVSFVIPGETEPVIVECRPCRLVIDELVGVGAEFLSLEAKTQKYVM